MLDESNAKTSAIKIAKTEIHKREDKRWVEYQTHCQSSMQSVECKKENHLILNQTYDILAKTTKSR